MQRWTSSFRFEWTPIITFARRRAQFLDWVEENLEPVAFYDREGTIGVAIGSRSVRLTVSRQGMTLEDGSASDEGVHALETAIHGVCAVLEPRSVELSSASIAWSRDLEAASYNVARRSFARAISFFGSDEDVAIPVDASGLMDVLTSRYRGQIEWGVVSADELLMRLSTPEVGRLAENRPVARLDSISPDSLPEASLFADTTFWPVEADELGDAGEILSATDDVEAVAARAAKALYERSTQHLSKEEQ